MPDALICVLLALILLAGFIFVRLWVGHAWKQACQTCFYPKHRCICCPHPRTTEPRWSENGYVAKCRDCHEVVYLGDEEWRRIGSGRLSTWNKIAWR